MTSILVVDDAVVDRRLVQGILSSEDHFEVATCESGLEALEQIPSMQPDVVVSDLQMPEMNGLELVSQIQLHYPDLPVVLITAHGSEELAVEALRAGAASYVPKTHLAESLVDTVDSVLATLSENKSHMRLTECLDSASFRFTLDSDLDLVGSLVGVLQDAAGNSVHFQTGKLHRFAFGLAAALTYVLCRGNLNWSLEEFEALHTGRPEAIDKARAQATKAPFNERKLRVFAEFSAEEVRIEISHEGDPLSEEILQFAPHDQLSNTSARGLVLMCAFFSSVELKEDGRTLVLHASTE